MTEPKKPTELAVPTTADGVRDLLRRAGQGDTATVPALRKLLEDPTNIDRLGGDLARSAEAGFVDALAGGDLAVREAVHAKLAALRAELLGESPTPVERLLVGRAVACWLQVQDADLRAAGSRDLTFRQSEFNQRRMDAAHRRYLSALKTLALVRKLAVPVLKVNIARKQVNVAGVPAG
ncbi:MAG: hypothetical protein C0501_04605 [Isosphaera sp.]|nr:hypothetical protein [Isosphaera sp.]